MRWLALGLVVLAAGCGGSKQVDTTKTLLALVKPHVAHGAKISNVLCIQVAGGHWDCLFDVSAPGSRETVAGTLVCDNENCIWKTDKTTP